MNDHPQTDAVSTSRSAGPSRRWLGLAAGTTACAAALGGAALFVRARARRAERRHPPRGRFLEIDGVRLHYLERDGARLVVIDSLNGYLNAMPEERFLVLQMHELLSCLNQLGVVTILVLAQHGLMGPMQTPLDISYLSDAVLMLRYFEAEGRVRRAISVVKKRSGIHEDTIREFRLSSRGLVVGPPLTQFRGIFTGTPVYAGGPNPLLHVDDSERSGS